MAYMQLRYNIELKEKALILCIDNQQNQEKHLPCALEAKRRITSNCKKKTKS